MFRGGFTLEGAEEVCSGDGLESYEVLDVLSQLVDKSLVVVEEGPGGEARYKLLETLRLYGTERLAETGRTEDVRGRHASYFLTMAERIQPELFTSSTGGGSEPAGQRLRQLPGRNGVGSGI